LLRVWGKNNSCFAHLLTLFPPPFSMVLGARV
jgi:hypothetical protein